MPVLSTARPLRGSIACHRSRAQRLQQWSRAQWRSLFVERADEWRQLRPPLANASYERWTWALCAVWSRSFKLRCAEPTCGGAAGTTGGGWRLLVPGDCSPLIGDCSPQVIDEWRLLAPGADLLNHGAHGTANAVLMQPPEGVRPHEWDQILLQPDAPASTEDAGSGAAAGASGGAALDSAGAAPGAATINVGQSAGSRGKGRRKARAVASTHTSVDAPRKRSRPRKGRERDGAPLAAGLSDVALGGGGGVWRWREMEGADDGRSAEGGSRFGGSGLPPLWMEKVGRPRHVIAK